MADICETIDRYEQVCKDEGVEPNDHVMKVFSKEKEITIFEDKENMKLYLAGNNHHFTQTRLTDADVTILYKALRNNLYINALDLRYNNITDEGAKTLATWIEESAAIVEVNVMCNEFGEEGAMHLAKSLHKSETLQVLRLNGNKIGNKGGMYFAQALQINTILESLDLGDCDLKTESVIALATVLNYNNTLKSITVNRPILFSHQEEHTIHYAKMLKVNRGLQELNMMKCDVRDFGAGWLSEHLVHNRTLTCLNLSCNRITRDGAKQLAIMLKQDTPLKVLDLSYNRLGDDGAKYLAEALVGYNTHLTTLSVINNEMNGKGLCAIADCMRLNTSLEAVYIWGNNIEESACIAFATMLENGRLSEKKTDVEPYKDDGVTRLSQATQGLRTQYYWGPSFGPNAQPELQALLS